MAVNKPIDQIQEKGPLAPDDRHILYDSASGKARTRRQGDLARDVKEATKVELAAEVIGPAEQAASDSSASAASALAAAQATGAPRPFGSYAAAEEAGNGGELDDGDVVQIASDEEAGGQMTRRQFLGSALGGVLLVLGKRQETTLSADAVGDLRTLIPSRVGQQCAVRGPRGGLFEARGMPDGWAEAPRPWKKFESGDSAYIWVRQRIQEGIRQAWFDIDYQVSGTGGDAAQVASKEKNFEAFADMVEAQQRESAGAQQVIPLLLSRPFWVDMTDRGAYPGSSLGLGVDARERGDAETAWPLVIRGVADEPVILQVGNERPEDVQAALLRVDDGIPMRFRSWGAHFSGIPYETDGETPALNGIMHGLNGNEGIKGRTLDNTFEDFHLTGNWTNFGLWLGVRDGTDYLRRVTLGGYKAALASWAVITPADGEAYSCEEKRLVVEDFQTYGGIPAGTPGNTNPNQPSGNQWYVSDAVQITARRGRFGTSYRSPIKHQNVTTIPGDLPGRNLFEDVDFGDVAGPLNRGIITSSNRPTDFRDCIVAGTLSACHDAVLGRGTRVREGHSFRIRFRSVAAEDQSVEVTQETGSRLRRSVIDWQSVEAGWTATLRQEDGALLEGPPGARIGRLLIADARIELDLAGTVRSLPGEEGYPGEIFFFQDVPLHLRTREGFRLEGGATSANGYGAGFFLLYDRRAPAEASRVEMTRPVFDFDPDGGHSSFLGQGSEMPSFGPSRIVAPVMERGANRPVVFSEPSPIEVIFGNRRERQTAPVGGGDAVQLPSMAGVFDAEGGTFGEGISLMRSYYSETLETCLAGEIVLHALGDMDFSTTGPSVQLRPERGGIVKEGEYVRLLRDPLASYVDSGGTTRYGIWREV